MGVKRKRRARNENLKQTMERYKAGIQYPYAGNKKMMEELFPGYTEFWDMWTESVRKKRAEEKAKAEAEEKAKAEQEQRELREETVEEKEKRLEEKKKLEEEKARKKALEEEEEKELEKGFFHIIPSKRYKDADIIKKYGENLKKQREKRKWTLKDIQSRLGIKYQAVEEIERGESRKKINRDYLVLFCSLYGMSPEALMGLGDPIIPALMSFAVGAREHSEKTKYVIERLIHKNNELLDVLRILAGMPLFQREKLCAYLSNTPQIKMLSSERINKIEGENEWVECGFLLDSEENQRLRIQCLEQMCQAPELLDCYVSIAAAEEKTWGAVLNVIRCSGYLEVAEEENK